MFIWQMTLTTRQIRALQALRDIGGSTHSLSGGDKAITENRAFFDVFGNNAVGGTKGLIKEGLVVHDSNPISGKPNQTDYFYRMTDKARLLLEIIEIDARAMTEELTHAKHVKSTTRNGKTLAGK